MFNLKLINYTFVSPIVSDGVGSGTFTIENFININNINMTKVTS